MAETAKSHSKALKDQDMNLIISDVASFASSIGLNNSLPNSGFDDSDFRKSGPLKPPKTPQRFSPEVGRSKKSNFQKKTKNPENRKYYPSVEGARPNYKNRNCNPLNDATMASKTKTDSMDVSKLPLVKASSLSEQWYVDAEEVESKVFGEGWRNIGNRNVKEIVRVAADKRSLAQRLLEQYTKDYESSRGKSRDMNLVMATQSSGTAKDKVAAFTCMVDDNPIANLRSLDSLIALVTSKVGKRHALSGFDALMDLFLSRLLPDRKMKTLLQQPLNNLPDSKDGHTLLLFWYWEECLKQRYERFVGALEEASKDMLPILKDKALKTIYSLLSRKPEQERRLLSALVNKLGDPVRKTALCSGKTEKRGKAASDAVFHLLNLLYEHPNMKAVVIEEVDSFIFRPHLGLRAKYYAVNFLSQICLSKSGDGPKIAKRLMDVYFALFKVLIAEGKSIHEGKKNNKKEDGKLLKGVKHGTGEVSLETSVEMDSRLLVALLTGVKRAFPYVSSDEAEVLVEIHTPMLFKLVHSKNFNVGVQALMLLYDISSKNQIASDRFYRALYSKLPVPAVMHSSKSEMFLQLLVKAMKNDINLKRISAFAKRLLQLALQQPPQYACGCLLILSDVLKTKPALWNLVIQNESVDEDFEHFEDILEEPQNAVGIASGKQDQSIDFARAKNDGNGLNHDKNSSETEDVKQTSACSEDGDSQGVQKSSLLPGGYNPQYREPSYCNADRTSCWELAVLALHAHPSVSTMARTLLSGAHIVYNGNPLIDLSLSAFLDKFMEKKPKINRRADGIWYGGSQIAPAKKLEVSNQLIGEDILSLAEEEVPPEDLVFHKFYMNKASSKKKKKKKRVEAEDGEELLDIAGDDESDSEEIDDILGPGPLSLEKEDGYHYDDLDEIAAADDDELIEADDGPDGAEDPDGDDSSISALNDGDRDDDDGDFILLRDKNKKRKKGMKDSPFANLEDYDYLLNDKRNGKTRKRKSRKKSV